MKINVEVNSETFEKLIDDGIQSLTKDEVKDIIKQAMLAAFATVPAYQDMLVKEHTSYGYSGGTRFELGALAQTAIGSLSMDEDVKPIKDAMVKALMEHHRELVEEVILRGLVKSLSEDYEFQRQMAFAVDRILSERSRGNH